MARVALEKGEAPFAAVLVAVVEADGQEGQRGVVGDRLGLLREGQEVDAGQVCGAVYGDPAVPVHHRTARDPLPVAADHYLARVSEQFGERLVVEWGGV
ncbi:hypothetical protein [Streptomyces atroolivaceus]|uniref:hypothetical protein n=1 Tax=Streptomyces atroolivaceus TaxID=66869 RepID=UPI003415BD2C